MMMSHEVRVLHIGLGRLGTLLAQALAAQGWVVYPARRHPTEADSGVLALDAARPWAPVLTAAAVQPTDVVLCLAPGGRTLREYQQAYEQPALAGLAWCQEYAPQAHVWLISSTSVYAQSEGEWVDEASVAEPKRATAQCIRKAEQIWLESPQPATVLRLAGLYGPGREALLRQAAQGIISAKPIYTNRIHVNDVARALVHLLQRRHQGSPVAPIYNVADQDPEALQVILPALRQALGWPEPIAAERVQRGSKRVSAQALLATGLTWQFPSWRQGYAELLQTKRAAGITAQMQLAMSAPSR